MKILGINYGGHDTSASLTINGKLIAACEEERYNKDKHTRSFPNLAIKDCLKIAKLKMQDIDIISLGSDPMLQIKEKYLSKALQDNYRIKVIIDDIKRIKNTYNTETFIRKKTGFKKKSELKGFKLIDHISTVHDLLRAKFIKKVKSSIN